MISDSVDLQYQIKSYSYQEYRDLHEYLILNNTTTGKEITPERVEFTKLNLQRIKRIEKQVKLHEKLVEGVNKINRAQTWIVIAEAWCGDGAQIIPVIAKAAALSPFVELKIVLRDEHHELMDQYLTNGTRSIPKLIIKDAESMEDLAVWGPRPKMIAEKVKEFKAEYPQGSKEDFHINLHLWYARDKGVSIQQDLIELFETL